MAGLLTQLRQRILTATPHLATASGDPCAFTTTVPAPLKSCVVSWVPVQDGSGTPSPDNIRPIHGQSGITLTNGSTVTVCDWSGEAGVVYGGSVDLVTGEMTVTHAGASFRWGDVDVSWTLDGYVEKRIPLPTALRNGGAGAYSACSVCTYGWDGFNGRPHWYINDGSNRIALIYLPEDLDDDTVVTVYGTYSTPVTATISPFVVRTVRGANSITADCGGSVGVTYWKK